MYNQAWAICYQRCVCFKTAETNFATVKVTLLVKNWTFFFWSFPEMGFVEPLVPLYVCLNTSYNTTEYEFMFHYDHLYKARAFLHMGFYEIFHSSSSDGIILNCNNINACQKLLFINWSRCSSALKCTLL